MTDQSGGVLNAATIDIRNAITGYQQATTTDATGFFRFNNVPFNNYKQLSFNRSTYGQPAEGSRKQNASQYLTNKVALYSFLSTFGGTHFIQPRSYQAKVGFTF